MIQAGQNTEDINSVPKVPSWQYYHGLRRCKVKTAWDMRASRCWTHRAERHPPLFIRRRILMQGSFLVVVDRFPL